jgi:hypothetical protein
MTVMTIDRHAREKLLRLPHGLKRKEGDIVIPSSEGFY